MLVEIIFKGIIPVLNISFLSKLMFNSKEVRFNDFETLEVNNFKDLVEVINSKEYSDLVITTDYFKINEEIVRKVFINLTKDGDNVELLIYFDLCDLNIKTDKNRINLLMIWANQFKKEYNFGYYVCQPDNANEKEYYFDSIGIGSLYESLNIN